MFREYTTRFSVVMKVMTSFQLILVLYRYLVPSCILVSTLPPALADQHVVHDFYADQEIEVVFPAQKRALTLQSI